LSKGEVKNLNLSIAGTPLPSSLSLSWHGA